MSPAGGIVQTESPILAALAAALHAMGDGAMSDGDTTAYARDVATQVANCATLADLDADQWTGPEQELIARARRAVARG